MSRTELRFLVDIGVGKKVEEWLEMSGYDVKTVRAINPRMKDKVILNMAVSESRMIITMDKDFGELVYNSGQPHAGVLLLRLEDAKVNKKVRVIEDILGKHSNKILNKFCVYQSGRLRIRKQSEVRPDSSKRVAKDYEKGMRKSKQPRID